MSGEREGQRLDRWLWCARFFKSRTLAAKLCNERKVRINRRIAAKASAVIRIDDVLTFPQARAIRVVRIKALAARRGPAVEARELYADLSMPASAPAAEATVTTATRVPGSGRPTKRQRRAMERLTEEQP